MLRTCIGLALGAALLAGLTLARRPATAADGTTGPQVTLKVQLEKGLRAMRPQEFDFLAVVEQQVGDGDLPADLVNTAFLWARRRPQYRVQFFEKALRQLTKRAGVAFDTGGASSFNKGFNRGTK
ncbi:MAG TPA: hypothetical protein VMV69_07090 [Pirellulales bacterium]|nr:hypothetical protein [Pirellulales bacterium]